MKLLTLLLLLCWCPLAEGSFLFSFISSLFNIITGILFPTPASLDISFAVPFDDYMSLISITDGNTYDVGVSDITEITYRADASGSGTVEQVTFDYTFSGDDGDMFSLLVTDSESPFVLSDNSSPIYVKPGDHEIIATSKDANSMILATKTLSWKFIDSSARA